VSVWELPSLRFKPQRHSLGGPGPWSGHLAFAYDVVASERPKLLVELGAFYGESYFGFCQAVEENSVSCSCYAVDTWQGDTHGGFYGEEIYSDVEAYNRSHYSSFSHLLRMTFDEALSYFADESIDLLHIDGHHSYDSVRRDFESWVAKVRPGGVILLHDICVRKADFGVWRFWQELSAAFPHFAFTHSAGLGVVVKPGPQPPQGWLAQLLSSEPDERVRIGNYYATLSDRFALEFDRAQLRKKGADQGLCSTQIFYSDGAGYSEEKSAVRLVGVGRTERITFELPEGIPAAPLRFDPADRACIVEILEISVAAADRSAILWRWQPDGPGQQVQSNGTARLLDTKSAITVVSEGVDPQLIFPDVGGELFDRPLEIDVVLRIIPAAGYQARTVALGPVSRELEARLEQASSSRDELRSILEELARLLQASGLGEATRREETKALLREELSGFTNELKNTFASVVTTNCANLASTMERSVEAVAASTSANQERSRAEIQSALQLLRVDQERVVSLNDSLEEEKARLRELKRSLSWRITGPARSVLGWFQSKRIS